MCGVNIVIAVLMVNIKRGLACETHWEITGESSFCFLHRLDFLRLGSKSHIDFVNNPLGAIICEVGVDIKRNFCMFMTSKILYSNV